MELHHRTAHVKNDTLLRALARQPTEHIAPYIRQPEELTPGKPLFYATATTLSGVATGVLVESHEGRPTKVEGNPEHPASLGALDAYSQASVLQLYDPDRSQSVQSQGEIKSWGDFLGSIREVLAEQKLKNGSGIRILTETVTSPTMADQIRAVQHESHRAVRLRPIRRERAHRPVVRSHNLVVEAPTLRQAVREGHSRHDFQQLTCVAAY